VEAAKKGIFSKKLKFSGAKCSASLLQLGEDHSTDDAALAEAVAEAHMEEKLLAFDEHDEDLSDGDLKRCGKGVERLSKLGRGSSIASTGKDEAFPASMESIATKGSKCGDSAANIKKSCAKFNHWMSLAEIKKEAASGIRKFRIGPPADPTVPMTCVKTPGNMTCKMGEGTKGKYKADESSGDTCVTSDPFGKAWTEDLQLVCAAKPKSTPTPTGKPKSAPKTKVTQKIFEVGPNSDGYACVMVGRGFATCKAVEPTKHTYIVNVYQYGDDNEACVQQEPWGGWKENLKLVCSA